MVVGLSAKIEQSQILVTSKLTMMNLESKPDNIFSS